MTDPKYKTYVKQRYKSDDMKEHVARSMGFDSYSELKFRNRRKVNKELRSLMNKELESTEDTGLV